MPPTNATPPAGCFDRPLKLLKGDAVDPAAAAAEVKRLIGPEKAAAVFGSFGSPLVIAASQVTELAGIPFFELGAICDSVLDRGFRLLFRSCSSATMLAALSVDTVGEVLARRWGLESGPSRTNLRVAILHEDGLYGSTVGALQLARCKERQLTVLDKISYNAAAPDLGNAVQRLRGADVTVVLHTGYQSDTVMFYRQMKQAGWFPRMVIGARRRLRAGRHRDHHRGRFRRHPQRRLPALRHQARHRPRPTGTSKPPTNVNTAPSRAAGTAWPTMSAPSCFSTRSLGPAASIRTRCATRSRPPTSRSIEPPNSWGARFDDKGQNTLALPVVAQWHGSVLRTVQPTAAAVAPLRPQLGS